MHISAMLIMHKPCYQYFCCHIINTCCKCTLLSMIVCIVYCQFLIRIAASPCCQLLWLIAIAYCRKVVIATIPLLLPYCHCQLAAQLLQVVQLLMLYSCCHCGCYRVNVAECSTVASWYTKLHENIVQWP